MNIVMKWKDVLNGLKNNELNYFVSYLEYAKELMYSWLACKP